MLHLDQFDIKTGKPIQVELERQQQTALKSVAHSYLEHWLVRNGINAQFSVARFYESINDADRLRLEREGKFLAFTSGGEGYFTDRATAQLVAVGSSNIAPIFAGDRYSPHNRVAYGSLISSDGVASTQLPTARILVIDNVNRPHGEGVLTDWNGEALSSEALDRLYDKMGDGTMLVRPSIMASLTTQEEFNEAYEAAGISADFTALGQSIEQIEAATVAAEQAMRTQSNLRVSQFRAATPSFPGMAKGTMTASQWTERLRVDAIISIDDIKGDDGRFSSPGIQEVSDFWINRKEDGRYTTQSVGPQVKYTIPQATELEFNPIVQEKAKEFASVAGDLNALSQYYVEQKERDQQDALELLGDGTAQPQSADWLYDVLTADKYGQLTGEAQTVRKLTRHVQHKWKQLAENGISVPSATAQPHSQLKPWEVCNKALPHGAIVAYYRSPFPNASAAGIGINNLEGVRQSDIEAFFKDGVAYLSPWTAKEIAITDFDGDRNGFFVGYEATVADLPQQIRAELASISPQEPDQQYEAGRALFERMIQQAELGQESRLKSGKYPLAVKEFVERTAPAVKPPQVNKQEKEKHPWLQSESQSAATWRAWGITADSPVGLVANDGMTLQALALEMQYASPEEKEALVRQHSAHFKQVLEKVSTGEVSIPSDDWLSNQGFSPFYEERIGVIAEAAKELDSSATVRERETTTSLYSEYIADLLSDIANGPNALNLQTAVDMAKSSKGINQELQDFVRAIQYKRDAFRQSKGSSRVYDEGLTTMPTSMEEPVSWNVRNVNTSYAQAHNERQLEERPHKQFRNVLPGRAPKQLQRGLKQARIDYAQLVKIAAENKGRLKQRLAADQQPTMHVRSPSGSAFVLQEISDEKSPLPIWRADGMQPNWKITVSNDIQAESDSERFPAQLTYIDSQGVQQTQPVGFVSPESVEQFQLEQKLSADERLSVVSPTVSLRVPYARENDANMLYAQADHCVQKALIPPEGQDLDAHRQAVFTEFWGAHFEGRKIVMRHGTDILCDRLKTLPEITVNRLQVPLDVGQQIAADSPHTIRFGNEGNFQTKEGLSQASVSVAQPEGTWLPIGAVSGRSIELPKGTTYIADMKQPTGSKAIVMQVMALPTVEQTKAEVEAFREGRSHLTFDYEPYVAYGVKAGDIVIAQAEADGPQVALQVQGQHVIDEKLVSRDSDRWASAEKSALRPLVEKLVDARSQGKELWGLTVKPLGTYAKGRIAPFQEAKQSQEMAQATELVDSISMAQQPVQWGAHDRTEGVQVSSTQPKMPEIALPPPTSPAAVASLNSTSQTVSASSTHQLWQRYSSRHSGVFASMTKTNPRLQEQMDRFFAKRAMKDGHSVEAIQEAITRHSPLARRGGQPNDYAKSIVEKETQTNRKQVQSQPVSRSKPRSKNQTRSKSNEVSL